MALSSPNLNKLLIPLVILIWVGLGLRMMGYFDQEPDTKTLPKELEFAENNHLDSFELILDYPDPFLGKLVPQQNQTSKKITQPTLVQVKVKPKIKIPKLSYQGLVQGDGSKSATAILLIDNKPVTVREGQKIVGLFIKSINRDKVEISLADTIISLIR